MRSAVAAAIRSTARAMAGKSIWRAVVTEPTLRTYWRAADSISAGVAGGSRPRSGVMLRHMDEGYERERARSRRARASARSREWSTIGGG